MAYAAHNPGITCWFLQAKLIGQYQIRAQRAGRGRLVTKQAEAKN